MSFGIPNPDSESFRMLRLSNSHIQLQAKEEQKLQKRRKRITRTHFEEILEFDFVVRRIWFAWLGTNSISSTISLKS